MNKVKLYYLFIVVSSLFPMLAKADHGAGAEILYEWISDSTYRLYYKFYRDCNGIPEPADVLMTFTNSCDNVDRQITLRKIVSMPDGRINGAEIGSNCIPSKCTYASSTLPGYQEWWYSATVTLYGARCDSWKFYYKLTARNKAITNLIDPGLQDLYVEATLNNLYAQGNSSPYFTVKPVPFVCNNVPYRYNNGANDQNGDSLYFRMIQPKASATVNIPYVSTSPAYNTTDNPLQSNNTFTINHQTGDMSFTPAGQQQAAMTLLVSEYRNNKLIGTVMRDMQVVSLACSAPPPNVKVNKQTIIGGMFSDTLIRGCIMQPLQFCFKAVSPDVTSVLIVSDNGTQVFSGSSISYTNQRKDSVTGCFSWTPGLTDTGLKVLAITVADSTCRSPGIVVSNIFTIPVYIYPQTIIYNDTAICAGSSVSLRAIGGGGFVWDVLPGGSPISSLSCTTCSNPIATPALTTRYTVESQVGTVCKNRDTVTIVVAYPPVFTLGPDTTTCINDSLQLSVDVLAAAGSSVYSVQWSPTTGLDNDTASNPIASPRDNIQYIVTLTPDGVTRCALRDTLNVRVLKGFSVNNHDTAICHGDAVQISGTGDANYNYTWTPSINVSNSNRVMTSIAPDTSGTYIVTARYPGCSDSSIRLYIEVQPMPVVTTSDDRSICIGDTLHLSTTVTPPYDHYSYNWVPGSAMDDAHKSNPVFSGVISRRQVVEVTTPAGCKDSSSLYIGIEKVAFLKVSNDTAMCPADSVQLHVSGDSIASIYWSPNLYISDTLNYDPFVSPERTQLYTAYGTSINNCRDTLAVLVEVKPAAAIHLPDSVLLYPGDSYQLSPETNCMYFSWFPQLALTNAYISNPVAAPEVDTRYYVTGTTEAGCTVRDSVDVFVSTDSQVDIPNAFAPGNGHNSILKVLHLGNATLRKFVVYNRWGIKMFETANINEGWDGMCNNQPQPEGVYIYMLEVATYRGRVINKQGNVTLLR